MQPSSLTPSQCKSLSVANPVSVGIELWSMSFRRSLVVRPARPSATSPKCQPPLRTCLKTIALKVSVSQLGDRRSSSLVVTQSIGCRVRTILFSDRDRICQRLWLCRRGKKLVTRSNDRSPIRQGGDEDLLFAFFIDK